MRSPERILVVRTDRVGDVVLATPLLRSLRQSFPKAKIAALVRPYTRPVLEGNPHLDEVIDDDVDGRHAGRAGFWRLVGEIRRRRFDTALLLLPTKRLAYLLWCAGIRTRVGVGTRLYQVITGMKSVSRNKYRPLRHEADYCLDLGRAVGVVSDDLRTEVFLSAAERDAARARLGAVGGGAAPAGTDAAEAGRGAAAAQTFNVLLHPGSGGSAPNWSPQQYAALSARLRETPKIRVIVTGGAHEKDVAAAFAGAKGVANFVGALSLRELMGVLSQCHLVISASTGPMHLAAALGVPTLSLFCPLTACSPDLWGPRGNASEIVLPPPDYCKTRCPGDPKRCTFEGGIEVADVATRVMTRVK